MSDESVELARIDRENAARGDYILVGREPATSARGSRNCMYIIYKVIK